MEPIIKETQVIRDHDGGWDRNTSSRSKWALGLGIFGAAAGGIALARQGGIGGILGPSAAPSNTVVYTGPASCPAAAFEKECNDILNVTKGMYDLYIVGQQNAAKARELDVAEKFSLYVNNRDNIDRVNGRLNDELFSLYKYTRDKDDETNAKIYDIAQQVAINTAVRPYQDKLIQCKIDEVYTSLINYVDRKTCRLIPGRLVLPSTPTVTGYSADCVCPTAAAAEAGA
ncbi:MAG: hypothetical protein U0K19_04865 [Bifidobacteriaceae bacterium]|nr:hypothetical protein [Bifidobacteriaceae bacterium]